MNAASRLKRLARSLRRRLSIASGKGVRSARLLGRAEFLALFDPAAIGASFDPEHRDAEQTLLDHFADRTGAGWPELPTRLTDLRIDLARMSDRDIIERADAALEHDLHPSGTRPLLRAKNRIDWSRNPTTSNEWRLMLQRHAWWPLWAAAYRLTGNPKYARAFVDQITDWIRHNPMPPLKSEHHAPWRLMECGLRLRVSWIPAFGGFYRAPEFTDDAKLLVLRSIYDHCNFLKNFHTNRNHLVRESNGLLAAAATLPEFRESGAWLAEALARLDHELREQVNPDGSHIEMSVGYQWLAIDEFEVTRSLLRPIGRALPDADLDSALERMYAYLAAVMRPDRCFPQLNDGFILWDADRLLEASRDFGRDDWEYIATCGASGAVPARASQSFPNAGVHVMRSGWKGDARYLVFDTGPYGGPHGHEDKLSFELFAFGTPFIVDPGSYTYQPDDPFRSYFVGSQGHNTILVDGLSQIRRWDRAHLHPRAGDQVFGEWRCDEHFDWARGSYEDGYAPFSLDRGKHDEVDRDVRHVREILFVKPDYWIVLDRLQAAAPHGYSALFHLAPDVRVVRQDGTRFVLQSATTNASLLVVAVGEEQLVADVVAGSEAPIQGWYSRDHHRKEPAATLILAAPECRSRSFVWLLIPLRGSDEEFALNVSEREVSADGDLPFDLTLATGTGGETAADSIGIRQDGPDGPPAINIIRSDDRRWPP